MDGGFVYQGEYSRFRKRSHGASSTNIAPERFVIFAQNHDHIGNRPKSDRLVTMISAAQARLVAALVLLSPGIPLLFMGEEYGEPAPFPYFVDHGDPDLIEAVRKGRAEEFASLADEGQLFDPADESTFQAARIHRQLRREADHRPLCELTGELIALRRQNPALRRSERGHARAHADKGVITLVRSNVLDTVTCLFNLTGEASTATLPPAGLAADGPQSQQCWHSLLGSGAKSPRPAPRSSSAPSSSRSTTWTPDVGPVRKEPQDEGLAWRPAPPRSYLGRRGRELLPLQRARRRRPAAPVRRGDLGHSLDDDQLERADRQHMACLSARRAPSRSLRL